MTDEENSEADEGGEEKSFRERVEEIRQQRAEGGEGGTCVAPSPEAEAADGGGAGE